MWGESGARESVWGESRAKERERVCVVRVGQERERECVFVGLYISTMSYSIR